jgi:hypothetical protein
MPPTGKPGKKRLNAEQRRALQLLASIPRGATEALLLAHGFRREMLVKLVLAGLVSVATETMRAGGQTFIAVIDAIVRVELARRLICRTSEKQINRPRYYFIV